MSVVKTGEVFDVILTDDNLYAIKVILNESGGSTKLAFPLDTSIKRIPLKGEIVLLYSSISVDASNGPRGSQLYYGNPIPMHQSPNNNAAPMVLVPKPQSGGLGGSVGEMIAISMGNGTPSNTDDTKHDLGEGFTEDSTISPLQPFLGDVLIEGRFGHSLRFGYTPQTSQTTKNPSWSSNNDSDPITILSNGRGTLGDNNKFIIEDIDDDKSSIWLTSSQKVRLKTSQKNIGTGVKNQSEYKDPSILITSNRILLNSKKERIILSSAESVNVATPNWAMDLDKLFTEIQNLVDNVIKLNENVEKAHDEYGAIAEAAAAMTHTSGMVGSPTGPPINIASFLMSKIKSVSNKTQSTQIKETIKQIQSKIKQMEQ
jgi:hypothetical protein